MATRTRTKGFRDPSTGLATLSSKVEIIGNFNSPKYPYYAYSTRTVALTSLWDSFSDNTEVMVDRRDNQGGINPCTHHTVSVEKVDIPVCTFSIQAGGTCVTTIEGSALPYHVSQMVDEGHLVLPDGLGVALARVPGVSKELLSGLNELYELKDLKGLLEMLPLHLLWAVARRKRSESLHALHSWLDHIGRTVRSPLGLLQALTGLDLAWKFGVSPVLQAVNTVHSVLGNLNAKVHALRELRSSHIGAFKQSSNAFSRVGPNVSNDTLGFYRNTVDISRSTEDTWVVGAIKGIDPQRLPSFDVMRLKMIRDKLGLSLDATDLWEAVPYSFVVDWFLPVQTYLEQFRVQPDPSWILTFGAWRSHKRVTTGDLVETIEPIAAATGISGNTRVSRYSITTYEREPYTIDGLPHPTYIPNLRYPGWGQSWTGLELVLQRIKRTLK